MIAGLAENTEFWRKRVKYVVLIAPVIYTKTCKGIMRIIAESD